ncbi:MAG: thiamine phosphate synthase [bacterium]|nr:thiamine phosphate synthase [bacterium]
MRVGKKSRKRVDYSLYLVADRNVGRSARPLEDIVERALQGGVTLVQLREKESGAKDFISVAKKIQKITRRAKVPLIINDRVDIALAIDADGAHVGQSDMPAKLARELLGPKKILGVSAKTPAEALRAQNDGADYLGVGDIFGTRSKDDAGKPIGSEAIRRIARAVSIPVVGIGGISAKNAAEAIAAGARGIAVISAIVLAREPEKAANELRSIVDTSLNK